MDDYLVNFAILLDTLVLTLFIYFAIETARQGFIINVVNSLRYIIAYFMALSFSERCTQYVYNNFISNKAETIITTKLSDVYNTLFGTSGVKELEGAATKIKEQLSFLNLDKFWQGIDRFTAESLSKNIANEIVYPAVKCVVSTILFFVILKLCKILATRLLFAFKGINRRPIIGGLNKVMGIAFGLFKATIITIILAGVVDFVILLSADNLVWLNTSIVKNTHIAKYFLEVSNMFNLDFSI